MKAIALTHYLPSDHPHCFIETELPDPTPGPRDLLVRVKATSINPVDTKVRTPKAKVEARPACWAGMPWGKWWPSATR